MYLKYFLFFLQISLIVALNDITESPFCKICKCDLISHDVLCDKIIVQYNVFNDTNYWRNERENSTYPYRRISIKHSGIIVITQIPESPVEVLDLSNNDIQIIEERSFRNLQNMKELRLSNNKLDSNSLHQHTLQGKFSPAEYQPLKSLKVLALDGNNIHSLHQDFFQHTSELEVLDLHGNDFKYINSNTLTALANLQRLKQLDLSYNSLTELPEEILHTLRAVEILNLTGNALTEVPSTFIDAKNLQWLSLDGNLIENITEKHGFPKMEKLKTLYIRFMPNLRRIEAHSMCGLVAIEELHISDNEKLSHIDGQALSERGQNVDSAVWPPLKKLYLRNNKLSYLNQSFLAHWDILEDIDIRDNPWACECETQWIVDNLMAHIEKINYNKTINVECSSPIEMIGVSLYELHKSKSSLRCLDLYGNRPERDASVVIGLLVGLLVFIPIVLGALFCYRRNWLGYCETGPASFSRKFYNRTTSDDMDF